MKPCTIELTFDSDDCTYEKAMELFESMRNRSHHIAEGVGEVKVFKGDDHWILSQEVKLTKAMQVRMLWLRFLKKLTGVST